MRSVSCDIVIFGAGVAGLWCRALLGERGFRTVALERDAIGSGQTIGSQGIIHAGLKYAISGEVSRGTKMLADEAPRWRGRLAGDAWPDLSAVPVLTDRFIMWTTPGWAAKAAGHFASGLLRSASIKHAPGERPPPFDSAPKGFSVWSVDEPAVDARGLAKVLAGMCGHPIIKTDGPSCRNEPPARAGEQPSIERSDAGVTIRVRVGGEPLELCAQAAVLAAGTGNERLLSAAGIDPEPLTQRRPLKMVVARGVPCALNGHCIGGSPSDKPRVTITSGRLDGRPVWYLGGDLAERGVHRTEHAQLAGARAVLEKTLPWLDLGGVEMATIDIDRAEGRTESGGRPEGPIVHRAGRVLAVWPTKLALAPSAAEMVAEALADTGVKPGPGRWAAETDAGAIEGLPRPALGEPVWTRSTLRWS